MYKNNLPLYKQISSLLFSYSKANNTEPFLDELENIQKNHLPSGSGIDNGVKINLCESNDNKLVFDFGFHHMDRYGFYCGWSSHQLTVRPHLLWELDLDLESDYNGVDTTDWDEETNEEYDNIEFVSNTTEEYLYDLFNHVLISSTKMPQLNG